MNGSENTSAFQRIPALPSDKWSLSTDAQKSHAEEMFKMLSQALETLTDPSKKLRYDSDCAWKQFTGGFQRGGSSQAHSQAHRNPHTADTHRTYFRRPAHNRYS